MTILATIAEGELDLADVLLLVALILFVIGTAVVGLRRAITAELFELAGLSFLALALLVL